MMQNKRKNFQATAVWGLSFTKKIFQNFKTKLNTGVRNLIRPDKNHMQKCYLKEKTKVHLAMPGIVIWTRHSVWV